MPLLQSKNELGIMEWLEKVPTNPTMSAFKVQTIQGVPYILNTETSILHMYSAGMEAGPEIGTYKNETLLLHPDWDTRPATVEWLAKYRLGLANHTQKAVAAAAELQKAS
jgi:hypothetical protein